MNVSELPFDTEQMIANLKPWVETESPSFTPCSVNKVLDLATYDLVAMGASIQRVPGRMGFGDTLRATLPSQHTSQPGILICCHADTVHDIGSSEVMSYRREGNKLWGPGILGMKAGILICIEALQQLTRNQCSQKLPVTILIVPDREPGCPSSRELIEATAKNNKYVLVPEPATTDGGVCVGRYAATRYKLDVKTNIVEGIVKRSSNESPAALSAISEMARHLIEIEQMSTDDFSYSINSIQSGGWSNFAEKCTAEVVVQARTKKDVSESSAKIMALNSPNPDTGLHVNRSAVMPLWEPDALSQSLFSKALLVATDLGLSLQTSVATGGSIGNITGGMGIATLDGLGARGAGVRTQAEHIHVDSLVERAKLMAGLLVSLD